MLTEHDARSATPKPKAYKLSDFAGLYLLVTPSGTKLWRLKYRLDPVEKCISLGRYPGVPLTIARRGRDHVRAQLEAGIDPMEARRVKRRAAQLRREYPEISFSFNDTGELAIATRLQLLHLSVPHTNALRGFLLSRPDTTRPDPAAQ